MGSLDTLAPDQRAVLDLVLQRGRGYDDIARLLSIDRAAVRTRALAACDELGPGTGLAFESRALIADYLLGQLPERVAAQTRERLASTPSEREWARVLASQLAPMASQPLPEIPDGPLNSAEGRRIRPSRRPQRRVRDARATPGLADRPSSRRGGAIMLGVGALVVVGLVVVVIAVPTGGSPKHAPSAAGSGTSPAGASSTATTSSTASQAQVVAQVNLNPPNGAGPAKGVGVVVNDGSAYGIIIQAQHIPPNRHNAYAAWLYNSPSDAYRLGFVNPGVGQNGQLQTGGVLPAAASRFKQLLLTLETQTNPKSPGRIVLAGPFQGVPASG